MKSKRASKKQFEPIKEVGIVRDRGQLTIPSEIRQVNKWLAKDTPVNMYAVDSETIVIKPVTINNKLKKPKANWDRFFKGMEKAQKAGNQNVNLTEYLINDRQTRD